MEQLIGVGLVVLATLCSGINPILARFAYTAGVSPTSFLFIRFLIAGMIMFAIMQIQHRKFPTGHLLWTLIFVGGIGMMASTWCYYTALLFSPPGIVAVLAYTYPVLVALLSAGLLKTPVTRNMIIALALTLTGAALTVGTGSACGEFKGMFLAWLSGAIFALYIVFGSVCIKKAGSIPALAVTIPATALAFLPIVALEGLSLPSNFNGWLAIGGSVVISTVLGMYLFYLGLRRINPTDASMISTFEIVVVIALSVVLLGEPISLIKICGATLILVAVILLARSGKMKRQVPRLPEPGMIGFKRRGKNSREIKIPNFSELYWSIKNFKVLNPERMQYRKVNKH
jgi:drug/metabolite transporter (DMT)-like permease